MLIEQRERIEEAKLHALKQAASQGWADVSAERYAEVADDRLEDFVAKLGALQAPAKYRGPDGASNQSLGQPQTVLVERHSI